MRHLGLPVLVMMVGILMVTEPATGAVSCHGIALANLYAGRHISSSCCFKDLTHFIISSLKDMR